MPPEIQKENRHEVKTSVISAFWVICGYSFIGFSSLAYGISLQLYNYTANNFLQLFSHDSSFMYTYILLIIVTLLYNLLFCHAYASLYLNTTNTSRHIYSKLGHWLETILVIVILAYYIPTLLSSENKLYSILILLTITVPWGICTLFYRIFLPYQSRQGGTQHERLKYRLIIPAMLMVATNVYIGSCIVNMWNKELTYFISFIPLALFIIVFCLSSYFSYKKNNTLAKDNKSSFERAMPYLYYCFVVLSGIFNLYLTSYWHIKSFDIPIRSLFLASFVAVYLGMFEGWFLLCNKEDKNANRNKIIHENIDKLFSGMPLIVCLFFPFQKFEIVYYIGFILGHTSAWLYWNYYNNLGTPKPKQLSFCRALFGVLTLAFLILDKWLNLGIDEYIGKAINTDVITDINYIICFVELIICICSFFYQFKDFASFKILEKFIENWRFVGYFGIALIHLFLLPIFNGINPLRKLLAIFGCVVFVALEVYFTYQKTHLQKKDNTHE